MYLDDNGDLWTQPCSLDLILDSFYYGSLSLKNYWTYEQSTQISERKEIREIRVEINGIETKKIQRKNETKS